MAMAAVDILLPYSAFYVVTFYLFRLKFLLLNVTNIVQLSAYYLASSRWAKYCDQHVCISVHLHIYKTVSKFY